MYMDLFVLYKCANFLDIIALYALLTHIQTYRHTLIMHYISIMCHSTIFAWHLRLVAYSVG